MHNSLSSLQLPFVIAVEATSEDDADGEDDDAGDEVHDRGHSLNLTQELQLCTLCHQLFAKRALIAHKICAAIGLDLSGEGKPQIERPLNIIIHAFVALQMLQKVAGEVDVDLRELFAGTQQIRRLIQCHITTSCAESYEVQGLAELEALILDGQKLLFQRRNFVVGQDFPDEWF